MKYYVLANIGQYEPAITECKTIEEAKKEYKEQLGYRSDVRIAKDLQVTIEVIEDAEFKIRQ